MNSVIRAGTIAFGGLGLWPSTATIGQAAPPALTSAAPAPSAADLELRTLYDAYARWDAPEGGYYADSNGELQPMDHLPRADAANQERRAAYRADMLAKLKAIPLDRLSPDERVNAAVFRTVLENELASFRFRTFEKPFNSDSNFWTYLDSGPLADAAAFRRYIGRMRDLPRFFDENIANMRSGLARGFAVPKVTLVGRDQSIANFITDDPAKSAFYAAFETMPSTIPGAEQAQLRDEAKAAIAGSVAPAYRRLIDFYRNEYLPKAQVSVSARDLPDGDAFYDAQVREYTTTNLTPEAIHELGLKEVARIEAAMREQMVASGWKGSLADFLKFLKSDPQFYAKTPDELMGVASYVAKRADGELGKEFGLLPRYRFGIREVAPALAPFYTAGRGGLEYCQMNTYDLPTRPLYNIPALTLHECAPGHSMQAALSLEQKALPAFRRNLYFSGYGEGWGLYSEWLGNEMGIYRTPYEKFGQLSYEMWRAARLVIDTGLHRYGWSRKQAIDYLASHTALSQHEVETEVDRYISWPGQALAYKLGELTIRKLRSEAEAKLEPSFDKKGFHDTILAMGAVPLNVLEAEMRKWIANQAVKAK